MGKTGRWGKAAGPTPSRNPGVGESGSPELSGAAVGRAHGGGRDGVTGRRWWSTPGGSGVAGVAGPDTAVEGVGMTEGEGSSSSPVKAIRRLIECLKSEFEAYTCVDEAFPGENETSPGKREVSR